MSDLDKLLARISSQIEEVEENPHISNRIVLMTKIIDDIKNRSIDTLEDYTNTELFILFFEMISGMDDCTKVINIIKKYESYLESSSSNSLQKDYIKMTKNTLFTSTLHEMVLELVTEYKDINKIHDIIILFGGILSYKEMSKDERFIMEKLELFINIPRKLFDACYLYRKVLEKQLHSIRKVNTKQILRLKELIRLLENNKDNLILTIDEELLVDLDDEDKFLIYMMIYNNIDLVYNEQIGKNNDIYSNNGGKELCLLLASYGLSISLLNKHNKNLLLNLKDINKIENILEALESINLRLINYFDKGIIDILVYSNMTIVSNIIRFLGNNIITLDFIKNNLGIFIEEDINESNFKPLYNRLVSNIDLFNKNNVDYEDPEYDCNLLLTPEQIVRENNTLSEMYGNTTVSKQLLLVNNKYYDIVDILIENGIDPSIIDFKDLINLKLDLFIKKLKIANILGIRILNENKLRDLFYNTNSFIIDDEEIDCMFLNSEYSEYNGLLSNYSRTNIVNNDMARRLDSLYMEDANIYNINGIIISRFKVLRNLTILLENNLVDNYYDALLIAITYNMILNEEELEIVKEVLQEYKNVNIRQLT